ncbi:hypothetical protein P7C73_g6703, partial [Tremellales sp. Uapishka_1]
SYPAPPQTAFNPPSSQSYGGYNPTPDAYAPDPSTQNYQKPSSYGQMDPQPQGYGLPPSQPSYAQRQQQQQGGAIPPPPRAMNGSHANTPPPLPAAQRRDIPGWNDAPQFAPPKRPTSAAKETSKPQPIMSPFPNSVDPMSQVGVQPPSQNGGIMSPPRGQPGILPPPPKGGPRAPSAPPQSQQARPPPTPQQQQVRPPPPRGVMAGPPPPRALSPLGPGSQRVASPMMSQLGQGRPPPPPGTRVGGPPPPGRSSSVVNSQPQPPQPILQSPPTPVQPAQAPTKALHPKGDRSHIPPTSKPIYDVMFGELTRVKESGLPAHVQKILDDTERRLNILFDGLNNETVPQNAIEQMNQISKAIAARDANAALAMHVELLTTATGDMTAWAPGVKQLIRLGL